MYAIVLVGGYAKRLWPLTISTPKALLPIAGKPILDYLIEKLQALQPPPNQIVLSTNMLFQRQFEGWLLQKGYDDVLLFPDCASCESEKPGAISALANIINKMPEEDVLVLAGDGMFNDNLSGLIRTFKDKKESVVAVYHASCTEEAKRCATVTVKADGEILNFTEKPREPQTTLVCGAVYLFKKGIRQQFNDYLASQLSADQPGRFVEWLVGRLPVFGYMLEDHLWDIGTPESYAACDEYFTKQ